MLPWILALLSALLTCSLAVVYLWWIKRRQKEMQLGLQALAGMHWREFSVLVKRMLRATDGVTDSKEYYAAMLEAHRAEMRWKGGAQ